MVFIFSIEIYEIIGVTVAAIALVLYLSPLPSYPLLGRHAFGSQTGRTVSRTNRETRTSGVVFASVAVVASNQSAIYT
jgi:hypothetical protein